MNYNYQQVNFYKVNIFIENAQLLMLLTFVGELMCKEIQRGLHFYILQFLMDLSFL